MKRRNPYAGSLTQSQYRQRVRPDKRRKAKARDADKEARDELLGKTAQDD